MNTALSPINPDINATVMASAGSGKTWLLVTRIIRLLIDDNPPDTILAITFTRKAAAEMELRLSQRLFELSQANETSLHEFMQQVSLEATAENIYQVRNLYEKFLSSPSRVKTTTFHAFCQDILRNFPLEADVPPGFELAEKTGELISTAWAALYNDTTKDPDSELAQALEYIFEQCAGPLNTYKLLNEFLNHRSEWLAYIQGIENPIKEARHKLSAFLEIDPGEHPLANFPDQVLGKKVQEFSTLLVKHATKTNLDHATLLSKFIEDTLTVEERLNVLIKVFLTAKMEPRVRKESKAQAKNMGEGGQQQFLAVNNEICDSINDILDKLNRHQTYFISSAWYLAGSSLLDYYQRIKSEQRFLDFSDLEWKAYQLLNHADNALWVQYKLDQRINHLLIDEFQDTNPTQWHLILPLLQELAANESKLNKSVFLVGDSKQSIYRFRRAEPRLFPAAHNWLEKNLTAKKFPLDTSWRSSPAIINIVNTIFDTSPLKDQLDNFVPHKTMRESYWGKVELLPLSNNPETMQDAYSDELRNPLERPRDLVLDLRHRLEAKIIAEQIKQLISEYSICETPNESRITQYSDIMVLFRNRNHIHDYEHIFREFGIPYIGANKGTLLENIEIKDMVALLETLATPYNNIALATVLRSPLFSCSDDELIFLSKDKNNNWFDKLNALASNQAKDTPLFRAWFWLNQWRPLVGKLPVHDLLDRIYTESDIYARYEAAFPKHLKHRTRANLTRFIELALEIDSGRYPSLMRFLAQLEELRKSDQEGPDETPSSDDENRVRIMTIHASKGLEAPIVFLADSTTTSRTSYAHKPIIHWPVSAERPESFYLTSKNIDSRSKTIIEQDMKAAQQENANLLYVALTRAKQFLFISGCMPKKNQSELGWYGDIAQSYDINTEDCNEPIELESYLMNEMQANKSAQQSAKEKISDITPDPRLTKPMSLTPLTQEIAPSRTVSSISCFNQEQDDDGRLRGIIIHQMLQVLCEGGKKNETVQLNIIANIFSMPTNHPVLSDCWQESLNVYNAPGFREFFDPELYTQDYNEVAIEYRQGEKTVYGIIDRLIVKENEVTLIDYKTHRGNKEKIISEIAPRYYMQLKYYLEGIRKIWPDKGVRAVLLFTNEAFVHECPI